MQCQILSSGELSAIKRKVHLDIIGIRDDGELRKAQHASPAAASVAFGGREEARSPLTWL
jgi:hypothetical protein